MRQLRQKRQPASNLVGFRDLRLRQPSSAADVLRQPLRQPTFCVSLCVSVHLYENKEFIGLADATDVSDAKIRLYSKREFFQ